MIRSTLIIALLALGLTACGQKPAEQPAAPVTTAAPAPATDASAPVAASAPVSAAPANK